MGRPTSYKPEYCKMLVEHMSKGKSFETFANQAKCCIDTLYKWTEANPEFAEAKKQAFNLNREFWEQIGIDGLHDYKEYDEKGKLSHSKSLNPTLYIFNMKNRFPNEWRDRKELNQNIEQTTVVSMDESSLLLMNELLKELIKAKNE